MSTPLITPSKGESLYLARRRKKQSQVAAAKARGVSEDTLREWERDRKVEAQPWAPLGKLSVAEVCVVLRRRAGKTQRQIAAEMGITRLWVIQMENGVAPVERLRSFWGI